MSKDTFYFSHDYNARNDSKIKRLLSKHGYLGYGIFWAIIEDLYNNANALPTDYESIAFDLRTTENVVESIINDFDLFIIDDNIFGSHSIQKRLEERDAKSTKARESAFKRWNKKEDNANALPTDSDCNAIKERKGKKNKVNESKVNNIISCDILNYDEVNSIKLFEIVEKENKNYQAIKILWNRFAEKFNKPKIIDIEENRKSKLKTRFLEKNFNLKNILMSASEQNYLIDNGFFTFDWMIESKTNYTKVLEGNYKLNKEKFSAKESKAEAKDKRIADILRSNEEFSRQRQQLKELENGQIG